MATGEKAPGAFRTIGELSNELGVAQHILRYWETKFPQLRPLQRAGNRRYYRPADVELARRGLAVGIPDRDCRRRWRVAIQAEHEHAVGSDMQLASVEFDLRVGRRVADHELALLQMIRQLQPIGGLDAGAGRCEQAKD